LLIDNKFAFKSDTTVTSISLEKIFVVPDPFVGITNPFATIT
jgi:hypothetical protein